MYNIMLDRPPNFSTISDKNYIIITSFQPAGAAHSFPPPAKDQSTNKFLCLQPVCGGWIGYEYAVENNTVWVPTYTNKHTQLK